MSNDKKLHLPSQQIVAPDGSPIGGPPPEEMEATSLQVKEWAEQGSPENLIMVNWSKTMEAEASSQVLHHASETMGLFMGARIIRHQMESGRPPKVVQVVMSVRTFDEMPEARLDDGSGLHEGEGASDGEATGATLHES